MQSFLLVSPGAGVAATQSRSIDSASIRSAVCLRTPEVAAVGMLVRPPSATSPHSLSVDPPLTYLSRQRPLSPLSNLLLRWTGAAAVFRRLHFAWWPCAAAVFRRLTVPFGSTGHPILPLPCSTLPSRAPLGVRAPALHGLLAGDLLPALLRIPL